MTIGLNFNDVSDVAEFKLGTVMMDIGIEGPYKCYKYVQYVGGAGSVPAVAGQVTAYFGAGGYKTNVVTSDYSDAVGLGAGVLLAAPASGQFCWVQIGGPATLSTALTAGADGNALTVVGAGDGTLDVTAAVTSAICAFADDVSAQEIVCCFPR